MGANDSKALAREQHEPFMDLFFRTLGEKARDAQELNLSPEGW